MDSGDDAAPVSMMMTACLRVLGCDGAVDRAWAGVHLGLELRRRQAWAVRQPPKAAVVFVHNLDQAGLAFCRPTQPERGGRGLGVGGLGGVEYKRECECGWVHEEKETTNRRDV